MRVRLALVVYLSLVATAAAQPQAPGDFTGHWEGVLETPLTTMALELDLSTANGVLIGTMSSPGEGVDGLPITIARQGSRIQFHLRDDQPFTAVVSADGSAMEMTYTIQGFTFPFVMTRTGAARVDTGVAGRAVGDEMAGRWQGTLNVGGTAHRLLLTVVNNADGTVSATVINVDQGRLRIPASAVSQAGTSLTLEFRATAGRYAAALNDDRTRLTGVYRQGTLEAPLTFEREMPGAN